MSTGISKVLSYPRFKLVSLPTPLEKSRKLGRLLGIDLWFKRDDLMEFPLSGNKARKLEYILGHAIHGGYDTVITSGALHSNHARITVAAASRAGIEAHVVLYKHLPSVEPRTSGNILLMKLLGGKIHFVEKQEDVGDYIEKLKASLVAQGRKPYVIPPGGACEHGVLGYVVAALEIFKQSLEAGFKVNYVVHASGTAATQAGLVLGFRMLGLRDVKVVGISVGRKAEVIAERALSLAESTAKMIGADVKLSPEDFTVVEKYTYGGYGVIAREVVEVMKKVGSLEGLVLDPVYTGKAMAGLIDMALKGELRGSVVFLHTGGLPVLFQYDDEVAQYISE